MNVFDHRQRLVDDYAEYTRSFIKIRDKRIADFVSNKLDSGAFWPEPLLQLNPTFQSGGKVDELVDKGVLHPECARIFRIDKTDRDHSGQPLSLHKHQSEAILKAKEGKSYVLTSGTGSGKSLTYIIPIVDHILRNGSGRGIQAVVVYPMNALANSQNEELKKFLEKGYPEGSSPVTFARYTGQEKGDEREKIRSNPPDILLTNYMMLELMLTRHEDREIVRAMHGLKFLAFDELHTYRGRQGADVALLIRRCRMAFGAKEMICIGTSATMASGGTTDEQKLAVANVATTLFGVPFDSSQVIGETLERSTAEISFNDAGTVSSLRDAIVSEVVPPTIFGDFKGHPLSSWIETTFGVRSEAETGRLIRQTPRRISGDPLQGLLSASQDLADLTGTDSSQCARTLRNYLIQGADEQMRASASSRFPIFAFRLHQFFTRGDTVWTSLESEDERHLEISKKVSVPGFPEKPLFPLVFCRQCGTAYYRIKSVVDESGRQLIAREDRRGEDDDGVGEGYLYLSQASPWPRVEGTELLERLPATFKEEFNGAERITPARRKDLPEAVFVTPQGRVVSDGHGIQAAIIPGHFQFCLDPACGVVYAKNQKSERSKLATLGVDNRSTATTILAIRSLIELQRDQLLEKKARKLLSFTDNRQDASLQAGHFNDFAQVALLRSALHKATAGSGTAGLNHGSLSRAVFESMGLLFEEYASDPDVRGPAVDTTNAAFRKVLDYYLYRDLQRGWRVTAPNLEDCGLLRFDYDGLSGKDSLLADDEVWTTGLHRRNGREESEPFETPEALRAATLEVREELLRTLLDVMRRALSVKVEVLEKRRQLDLIQETNPRLREDTVWYLSDLKELVQSTITFPRPKHGPEYGLFISSYGGFGKLLKRRLSPFVQADQRLSREELDRIIGFLLLALKRYGIVEQVSGDGERGEPGYQINADALRWLPGDGTQRPADKLRMLEIGEIQPEVNQYFLACYRNFVGLKCLLEAREHTAQVAAEDREDREERFRSGDLPLLFCSPTMELGVDIAQLNVVNLRNVPPTPANYAQRSGRAGRGGQPALVFTYCAGRSPHDQFYFREPNKMVAGAVTPPRIDIRNRDLLRAHVHAIWMEVVKPDLGKTLNSVLDLTPVAGKLPLPIKTELALKFQNPAHRAKALAKADELLKGIAPLLESAAWYHENWARDVLDQVERSFYEAAERWRSLYRSAERQRELHHKIIGDHTRPEKERDASRRLRAQAESQIRLLTEAEGIFEGDFYSYRYFAAEGFLPGYNFPRLPLSAFVPARRRGRRGGRDEYISRPRFLAISEFGPRALVYHEGSRYRVDRVNLDFGSSEVEATHDLPTAVMKRCPDCGFAHLEGTGRNLAEVCDRCGSGLEDSSKIESLVHLQNVSLKLAQKITCDEEERRRLGYKILTSYRFPEVGGQQDRKDAEVYAEGSRMLKISYGDATDLFRINIGWASRQSTQPPGFMLDLERGIWASNKEEDTDAEDAATQGRNQRVVPYVKDTKNALVLKFEPTPTIAELAALQSAFREAIQKFFQLEPRELSAEPMPSPKDRKEILFYESSEGGAGALRQIAEDPTIFPILARMALEICHYDPDTLEDLGAVSCGKACYECLLDYGNQSDHKDLDRQLIRDFLFKLSKGECRPSGGRGSREERMVALRKRCDSALEQKWLGMVDDLMLRPPSDAQYLIESCSTKPDFYYKEFNAAVYIDGPPHDEPDQIRKDEVITRDLIEAGYAVVRFHHKEDWKLIFQKHPDIFGALRS